jgi:mannitol/fructose-specific phosphotransferase system IIA component (Ntr-type)
MIPALKGTDRDAVLAELCQKLDDEGFVDDAGKLLEAAEQREAIISTAVENGLAFPHVRCVEGGALTFALGIAPKGIKFDPAGKANTRIIFFMVIPTAASAFYLKLLSGLSQVFQKAENREKLLEAETSEKMWKALVKATRLAIS